VPGGPDRVDLPVVLLSNLDRRWPASDQEDAVRETKRLGCSLRRRGHPVVIVPVYDEAFRTVLDRYDRERHIVFNWCESIPGVPRSEALAAQILDDMGFTYTGASPEAIRLGDDKPLAKDLLRGNGVPCPRTGIYETCLCEDWKTFPAIVKPAYEHCSAGVGPESVVMAPDDLRARLQFVLETFRQPAMVEDFIDGREFHVSVWGNEHVEVLPPAEMDFSAFSDAHDRLCGYDAKFSPDSEPYRKIRTIIPARLPAAAMRRLRTVSRAAYLALGCRDYARIDIRERDGEFFVLDVNPNADIGADASMALTAEKAGYTYGAMASRLLNLAAERHPVWGQAADAGGVPQADCLMEPALS
jgi:D-alanine-D-alanine ligase